MYQVRSDQSNSNDNLINYFFILGDRHVLLGTKNGQLIIVDIVIGEIIEMISAHEKELWSVSLLPDLRGCVTGGGDNTVKFWSFELINDPNNQQEVCGHKVIRRI